VPSAQDASAAASAAGSDSLIERFAIGWRHTARTRRFGLDCQFMGSLANQLHLPRYVAYVLAKLASS